MVVQKKCVAVADETIPEWPRWDNGNVVAVQPPVMLRVDEAVHECCRLCYDGGMWFLLDNEGRPWLSARVGEKFPSRFVANHDGDERYHWDPDSYDWVLSSDDAKPLPLTD